MFSKPLLTTVVLLPLVCGRVIKHPEPALSPRAEPVVEPVCEGGNLDSHDCNVSLLSLGGGIQGAIQVLRVDDVTNTATSGSCTMTVTAVDGGTAIDISKGRLEQAQKQAIAVCGRQAWSVTALGGAVGGNLKIVQSSSAVSSSGSCTCST
ncbi:hypothetical protein I302_105047 [Kwoniella bestiolae CBS 10118]|uniref:Uncharacterized protein n=1 Tax=Kwoniella bestiolae CBS 10118 TaxID=1296100 RepID=A0A1B9FR11_9TREE|nr:hypothetical protein I302_08879 [Kwoniella bestiolae CBS 10118]OCF21208.1 hypothetical protein I302_08879 [Kwoniella bestiolae CBS 10118]